MPSYFFFAARFAGFEVLRALVDAAFALLALLFFAPPLRAPLDFVALLRAVLAALLRAPFLAPDFLAADFFAPFLAPFAADFLAPPRFVPLLDFAPEVLDEVVLLLALAFGVEVLGSLMALPAASFILVMAD